MANFRRIIEEQINKLEDFASSENNEGRWVEEEKYLFAKECLENLLEKYLTIDECKNEFLQAIQDCIDEHGERYFMSNIKDSFADVVEQLKEQNND